MQVYEYTDKVIDKLNAYAHSLPMSRLSGYHLIHPEVRVPVGCLPIKITQFYRPDPRHYHWSIFIPTSPLPGIGHYYELSGDSRPFHIKSTINTYNAWRGKERGSHVVGYVLPLMLPSLEAHFALTPVEIRKCNWDSQNWVCNALKGLNGPLMFAVDLRLEDLVMQMAIVRAAWEAEKAADDVDDTTLVASENAWPQ